jgi:hypothetical protein
MDAGWIGAWPNECIIDVTLLITSRLHVMAYASRILRHGFCELQTTIMAPLKVHIKHAGKKHDLELDLEKPPVAFKEAVYQLTGVPIDRMKVMVKGGVLKVCRNLWKNHREKETQHDGY